MASTLVPNWLDRRASTHPNHPAVIVEGCVVTYAELARRARSAGDHMAKLGIRSGDPVAVLLRNGLEFVEIMHGLMRCGAVLVPLHHRLSANEIAQQVKDCRAKLLVGTEETLQTLAGIESTMPSLRLWPLPGSSPALGARADLSPEPDSTQIDLNAVHTIIYTSGSTGQPRGVQLTYGNHWWSAIGSALNLGVHTNDRWLVCLPLCHVGGLSVLLRSVIYGTTAVIHDGFDPSLVNRAIDEDHVTIVSVVATMLRRVLAARGKREFPEWLRCVLLGGGPAPMSLLEDCAERGVPVIQTYGLTEAASQVTTLAPSDTPRKLGSAGKPLLPTEIRIVGLDGDVAVGEIGNILVRGPTLTPGYISGEKPAFDPDGWLRTGDVGRLDDEGFLYVLGRGDDVIVSGGENVHPTEVEAVLQSHPAIEEVCVFGVTDPEWGARVEACVQLRKGTEIDERELREHARRLLAGFKLPRRIHFVAEVPRTPAGKLSRRVVRAKFESDPPTDLETG